MSASSVAIVLIARLLAGIEELVPDNSVKLGFRAHYPQLETKLTVRGIDRADIDRKLAPMQAEVRKRLGNFILAEDDQTLEGVVLAALKGRNASLAVAENFTSGQIAARIGHLPGAEHVFRRGIVARDLRQIGAAVGLDAAQISGQIDAAVVASVAQALRRATGASHGLAVLIALDEGDDRLDFGGTILIAIATANGTAMREARILGGREWVRLGATEMGLDCFRRFLQGLPIDERTDFEKK